MAVIDSYNTGDDGYNASYGAFWESQTFTASANYNISSVKLKMFRLGTPVGNMTVGIRATSSGEPTGGDLCSGTVDPSGWATDTAGTWIEIIFSATYALVKGTQYAIVVRQPSGGNSVNAPQWRKDTSSPAYTGGNREWSINSGSSWETSDTGTDYMFETYGTATPVGDKTYSKKLVAIGNSEIWYESTAGTMTELTAAANSINSTLPLTAVEAYEKIFIANGTNKYVVDFGNTKIATNNVGANPPDFHTILTGGSSGATMVVDFITALSGACTIYGKRTSSTTFTNAETVTGTDDDGNAISFVLNAAEVAPAPPHYYAMTTFGNSTTFGSLPDQANDVVLYRGRICWSADKFYPHQWYQSRQFNPWDYNYIDNDAQSPVAGGDADAGEIGDIVVVQIPYSKDFLIHGCANSMWVLSGDAAEGGSIDRISETTGILGPRAHCWDKNGNLFFVGTVGIIRIPVGLGPFENLTEQSYPDFIADLAYDPSLHRIVMGYDRVRHGIRIAKITLSDGTNSCWWFDLRTNGLFPETYPEEASQFCMFYYESVDPTYTGLLSGSFDGYIRYADVTAVDDDIGGSDEAISSYVTWGPLQLGSGDREGTIDTITGELTGGASGGSAVDSNDCTYKVFVDRSADGCEEKLIANSSPKVSGTINSGGRPPGRAKKKRVRGVYAGIRLENTTAAQTWGLERLYVRASEKGRVK